MYLTQLPNIMDDNVIDVVKQAIAYYGVKVSKTEIKKSLYEHPSYPTLKSVCDSFNRWKIENYALKLTVSEIKELNMPFIAHLSIMGGFLVFVKKISDDKVSYIVTGKGRITESFDDFASKLTGAVIVLNPDKKSIEKDYLYSRQNEIIAEAVARIFIFRKEKHPGNH